MERSNGLRYLPRPDLDTLLGRYSDYAHSSGETIIGTNGCDRLIYSSTTHYFFSILFYKRIIKKPMFSLLLYPNHFYLISILTRNNVSKAMPFILRINYDDGTTKDIIHLTMPRPLLPYYWRIKKFFGLYYPPEFDEPKSQEANISSRINGKTVNVTSKRNKKYS